MNTQRKALISFSILFLVLSFGMYMTPFLKKEKADKEFVPEWAKKVVWYQIFPDRFRNGDSSNDPTLESIKGSWPHDSTSKWEVHPWTSDWYKLQNYEKENGKDIWFNIQRRRYGGDLQGIIDKLDYLKNLGITAIYLNPIFESPSLHKYDGATYHHVDPHFGPDPIGDKEKVRSEISHDPATWIWTEADRLFLKLIQEVHSRKMYIIIDGVFNHMGLNSWAFKDVVKNQQNSKYKDWFKIVSWENPDKGTKFQYEGWYGVKELPELKQDENGLVAGPKKYIFDSTTRWMDPDGDGDPSDGIDGWRLDVAFLVKHNFWKDWRKHLKSINPKAYITAEIIDSVKFNKPYLRGDEFDAVMNYNFAFTCEEFFINDKFKISAAEFDRKLEILRKAYPGGVEYVMQNLFDSHDTNRLLSHIVNKDVGRYRDWGKYFELSKGSNPDYNTTKPGEREIEIQKLMVIFQMTYLGAPMIYYGDETGMWGANDPCCRKPMVWDDFKYDDEIYLPDQTKKAKADEVNLNKDLFEHYKKLIGIRNSNEVLQIGKYKALIADNQNDAFAFERYDEDNSIIVMLNNSKEENVINLPFISGRYKDLLNNDEYQFDKTSQSISIKPKWGRILLKIN